MIRPPAKPSDAIADWVSATLAGAVAYARSLLGDPAAAEDVVHDCYCRLLRKQGEYDLPRDGAKLLYRSVTNACINVAQRRRELLSLDGPVPDAAADPAAVAAATELERAIAIGLARLPVAQRAALELKSLGHSLQEIGEALGLTPGYAGVLVHRARAALAEELSPFLNE